MRLKQVKQRVLVFLLDVNFINTAAKMATSGAFEKKGATVDDSLADDRSTAEGQVYRSEEVQMDLKSERRYGEPE